MAVVGEVRTHHQTCQEDRAALEAADRTLLLMLAERLVPLDGQTRRRARRAVTGTMLTITPQAAAAARRLLVGQLKTAVLAVQAERDIRLSTPWFTVGVVAVLEQRLRALAEPVEEEMERPRRRARPVRLTREAVAVAGIHIRRRAVETAGLAW